MGVSSMNVVEEAFNFAIKAHKGQVRKADQNKPYIVHPIDVSKILSEYNLSEEVIAAGLLHDVLEDTSYSYEDILSLFGEKIAKLVLIATEENKKDSWEERKLRTINKIKNLNLEEKLLLCADKISNLEDMLILFNVKGKKDFSSFKRGEEKQYWYYINIYNSLSLNHQHVMFERLRDLITEVFEKEFYFDDKRYLEKEIKKISKLFNDNIIYNYGIEIYNSNKLIGKYNTLIEVKNYYEKKLMEIYG